MAVTWGYAPTVDGERICYITEAGAAPPVLSVLQSLYPPASVMATFSGELKLVRGLSGGHAWYEFDWRGTGRSSSPARPLHFEDLVCDIESVVLAIGEPIDLVAVNDGCKASLAFAARRPDLVQRCLLVAPIGEKTQAKEAVQRSIPLWQADMVMSLATFLKWVHPGTDEAEVFQVAKASAAAKPPERVAEIAAVAASVDLATLGSQVPVPSFILYTEDDVEDALELAGAMPDARAVNWTTIGEGTINGAAWRRAWDEAIPRPKPRILDDAAPAGPSPVASSRLSAREQEVLLLLAAGHSNKAIAGTLCVSPPTVATHVRHILEKTGSANRTEAAAWAIREGFSPTGPNRS